MHWDTFKQKNYHTVGGDGGCRVGKVRVGTTSPMPDYKGFKLQQLSEIQSEFSENLALLGLSQAKGITWF